MSNRWGNFCTPQEDALSQQKYSPLHCYTVGEIIGLLLVVISSLVSIVALLYVFAIIARNVIHEWRQRTGRRLISQPMDVFLLSLFISEFLMSIGGSINIKYIHDGKVQVGTTCKAQAVFSSVGPGTLAMITLAIAIYTFSVVWWRTGKGPVRLAWAIVGAIWTYNILFITITAWRYRWENFFHPTPFWCWMGKYYIVQRLFGEYFWMWSALLLSFLLYIPLFFWSKGYLTPDNQVWWKFHIHSRSLLWARTADPEVERRRSMAMIAYPILYAFLVLPQSIIRWLGFVQEYTGHHTNKIPPAATFAGRFIYGLSGLCNVILFLKTRPNLLLMTPPPESEFDDPASPTLSHRRSRRPGWDNNDRFAARAVSRSLESGERRWVGEDRKSAVVEGYERTSSDGGRIDDSKVVRLSSFVELGVRPPNGQLVPKS